MGVAIRASRKQGDLYVGFCSHGSYLNVVSIFMITIWLCRLSKLGCTHDNA